MSLRVIFMGTPDFATPTLSELIGQGHDVVAVYTREPAKAGRGMTLTPSPVHEMANRYGLPVFTPKTLKTPEAVAQFQAHDADVAVVVAYGMLLPQAILDVPEMGCLNLHGSLLPRWRGAAPLHRAIMAGDLETGVAVMRMEAGLDTGPVGMVERLAILPDMTTGELHDRLKGLGADLMARALAALERGSLQFREQPQEGVTYAAKISNSESQIDWNHTAQDIHNQVRGLSPFPGAYTLVDMGKGQERLKILRTQMVSTDDHADPLSVGTVMDGGLIVCGTGRLRLVQVQRAGKAVMSCEEWVRGLGSHAQRLSFLSSPLSEHG
jgi:methionyl-tRNA formyltransferase